LDGYDASDSINTFDIKLAKFYDEYLIWHQSGTAKLCALMAAQIGLNSVFRRKLIQAALVHDVGKLFILPHILMKDGELNHEEMALMKNHSVVGAEHLDKCGFTKDIVSVVCHHHERFDGAGYPSGIKGNFIPLKSRIITICDAMDAMMSGRHYKPKLSTAQVVDELEKGADKQFDPYLVETATKLILKKREKFLCSRLG
jgi:putative nucleotidyltransferase with HDIG domain